MFSLQRLLWEEDKFFDLLEASAQESRTSVKKNPEKFNTLVLKIPDISFRYL